ncbi:hypothetical protein OH77DRAFT_338185 [Trametes cingulata]|nr:hypothetical protein OH77DRAFT_338185 [Trametes cingulata]
MFLGLCLVSAPRLHSHLIASLCVSRLPSQRLLASPRVSPSGPLLVSSRGVSSGFVASSPRRRLRSIAMALWVRHHPRLPPIWHGFRRRTLSRRYVLADA